MSLPSLYSLTDAYRTLAHRLADLDLDASTVHDTIEASGLLDDISTKGQNLVFVVRSFEQHGDLIDTEIKRLQALKKRRKNTADGLRDYLMTNMIAAGITRIQGPLMTITIRENPEHVDVFDANQIPSEFMREIPATYEPDKVKINSALKEGGDVPGAKLVQGHRLHIA